MRLDWFIYHVASGHAFFTGIGLLVSAVGVISFIAEGSRWRRVFPILVVLGLLLIIASATPLPWILYVASGLCVTIWIAAEMLKGRQPSHWKTASRSLVVAVLGVSVAFEIPFHIVPKLPGNSGNALAVIADSITAGMGENEAVTWPKIVSERHDIIVHDFSAMGATVASAQKQAAKLGPEDDVVLLEIGGNDLLGSTSAEAFEEGLESLLRNVSLPGRKVIMFELPLPPTFNRFGLIQRRLATKYNVLLIPKRILMGVLTSKNATLDSIHLSQAGQDRMANIVWQIIEPAFADGPGI